MGIPGNLSPNYYLNGTAVLINRNDRIKLLLICMCVIAAYTLFKPSVYNISSFRIDFLKRLAIVRFWGRLYLHIVFFYSEGTERYDIDNVNIKRSICLGFYADDFAYVWPQSAVPKTVTFNSGYSRKYIDIMSK